MTEQEERERYRYLQLKAKAAAAAVDDEPEMDFAPKPQYSPEEEAMIYAGNKGRGMGELALEGTGKALDYAGGLVRTGLAGTSNLLGPDASIVSIEDLESALQGNAPSTSEYLGRAGFEAGPLRSAAGFLGDIATDPFGGAQLVKGAFKGGTKLATRGGEALYRKGFKALDRAAELAGKGKQTVSDVARNIGFKGGAEAWDETATQLINDLGTRYNKILKQADAMGATADTAKAFDPIIRDAYKIINAPNLPPAAKQQAQNLINQISPIIENTKPIAERVIRQAPVQGSLLSAVDTPILQSKTIAAADDLIPTQIIGDQPGLLVEGAGQYKTPKQQINLFENTTKTAGIPQPNVYEEIVQTGVLPKDQLDIFLPGELTPQLTETIIPGRAAMPVSKMTETKRAINNLRGKEGYEDLPELFKAVGSRARLSEQAGIRAVEPKLAREARDINKQWEALLSSRKKAVGEATKEINKNAVTEVDAMAGLLSPFAYLGKQGAKYLNLMGGATYGGRALESAAPLLGGVPAAATTAGLLQYLKSQGAHND
jgi:hypothetical protein